MKTLDSSNTIISPDPRKITVEQAKTLSIEDRLTYFKKVRVNHPKLSATLEEVEQLIFPSPEANLILLVGPPGVGKTLLITLLEEGVLARCKAEMTADPGFIPIMVINAGSAGDNAFSWKNLYLHALRKLGGPTQTTTNALRDGLERTLYWRRTQIVAIDEGVHMLRGGSDDTVVGHIEGLKSLSSMTGITILLSGSYDLLDIPSMSGQIARRISLVHFPRYFKGPADEEKAFNLALKRLVESMPIEGASQLEGMGDQLHLCTHGCVGFLKQILTRALRRALHSGGPLTKSHLRKALPTAAQLDAMIRETERGEQLLAKNEFATGAWDVLSKFRNSLRDEEELEK